jgi:hypothetical protein
MEKIKNVCKYIGTLIGMLFMLLLEVRPFVVLISYSVYSYLTHSIENTLVFLLVALFLYIKDRFDYLDEAILDEKLDRE